ncbi:MAG: hypothetical protein AYL30_004050 [Candidatus Hecatellales archaeon B24]|nr:MAG: hypothetical protein AYL30_004050 [Candidatus Hecatellales archaeon B24]
MRKKWAATLILIVTLSTFTLAFTLSYTQHVQPREKYEELASEVMAEISKLRKLNPPEDFKVEVVSSGWVEEHWGKPQGVGEPLEWKIYRALLLVPAEASHREFEREWIGHIMAASSGETLYIVADMVEEAEEKVLRRTLAHESVHILQYVNFEIAKPETHDAEQALNALIEGDADFSADMFLKAEGFKPPEKEPFKPEKLGYREALILIKLFPYQYGERFAGFLHEHGGWSLLDEAYRNPPSSTEQVIHPEKYLQGEGFEKPELPVFEEEGWKLLGENRLGEYFIYVLLARWVGYETAEKASQGWNGDWAAYYTADEGFLLVWATTWDSGKDAEEFCQATAEMVNAAGGVEIAENLWEVEGVFIALKPSGSRVDVFSSNSLEALERLLESAS